ncbi:tRNA uridine-5-carboxymethylaminomethyl(34) synthesis GTPase MnmE [Acidithiobacillus sp.]|jgi:tRNA modification GTPase|uniref:tRNA uridine-5-carboxymethylaminomethyl(34) synthesis GTPase MnmE n=1 Tax=Acidithiobacillus sp. TaxID=1872118 RepID=UPI0025C60B8E|nr:tRNA uridine-5-carboxymethylaminomethyl(34) synthesis GTPase MnmE [Acidithiobacillus sp.]MCK9187911.1 tRNA uridine-5-carboxymethylaminomethyl(34) synthesis GTPase MnmE [Acidithiobacillus sp.]MCK9359870.1 tRNA uridine-5-carboxymethylaminomethyl(34) synthesis GTPase MnmE [Acidithiobacillus sp.]
MDYQQGDTIVAIATPPGEGGVGILRLSGPEALSIATALCGGSKVKPLMPRHAHFRRFHARDSSMIDHGVALYFPAPHSYTGETVVELQGHGSPLALASLLTEAIALGARAARAGEFSERAFLNGRLDLAQAEAVADLIHARSGAQARAAAASLEGAFSQAVDGIHGQLRQLLALAEAGLDFSEEDLGDAHEQAIADGLMRLESQIARLLKQAQQGARLARGGRVVLVGRPNVGKSSLMNALAQRESAIVTAIPGTTRDLLREEIVLDGLPVELIDTAGLRAATDAVEAEGIARARNILHSAQLILLVADASAGWQAEDEAILRDLPEGSRRIIWNKLDLVSAPPDTPAGEVAIALSAQTGAGLEVLHGSLIEALGVQGDSCPFSARRRHVEALESCLHQLVAARDMHRLGDAPELVTQSLREAAMALSSITGRMDVEDILGEIFSRFCIGK